VTFVNMRGFVAHMSNASVDTITTLDGLQPILTLNAGTITAYSDLHCQNYQGIPRGGSITTSFCVKNDDSTNSSYTLGPNSLSGSGAILTVGAGGMTVGTANAAQIKGSQAGYGSATAPSFSFPDGTGTGFYETGANSGVAIAIAGTRLIGFNANQAFMNSAGGPELQNISTGSAPTLVPTRADGTAGIGANASGNVSIYADNSGSSFEAIRAAYAGTNIYNTLGLTVATWADNKTCTAGQISVDASYIYVCTATNTVERAALSSF